MFPRSKSALKAMKVSEKRALLSAHGKDATGKNPELTKRIEELCEEKGSPLP